DSDGLVGQAQRGVRRAQPFARITGALPAQVHEAVERYADLAQVRPKQVPHEPRVEVVAARRDGRMSRENDSGAGDEPRLLERHLARRPQFPDTFDGAEEAVTFVEVEDTRVDPQGAQRANPADAQHYFLAQPAVWFRNVEAVGDAAEVQRI